MIWCLNNFSELLEDINWVKDPARVTEEIPEAPISNRTNTNKSVIELHESVKDDKKMMKRLIEPLLLQSKGSALYIPYI